MRIGIDGSELRGQPTGVGRYLRELLRQWLQTDTGHRFLLYVPATSAGSPGSNEDTDALPASDRLEWRTLPGAAGTRWQQWTLGRAINRDRLDVFFAPAYSAPLRVTAPVVLTIHDVSFAAHPEWFGWREGLRRRLLTRLSGSRAAAVLTDSQFSRDEIVSHLGLPPDRVSVVPIGIHAPVPAIDVMTATPRGAAEPLVLFVGSLLNRRRIPDLIRGFARSVETCPEARLVIVGENRTYPREDPAALAASLGMADRVDLRAYASETELADLYRRARVFVFLSEYEGFGLTPLEALSAGVPGVVLDTPVAREVYGDAAVFVGAGDIDGLARAITGLLNDEAARLAILSRAGAILDRYSWPRAASQTLAIIESVARAGR